MCVADILFLHHACKGTGAIHFQPVIKHLDLDVRSRDCIVAVGRSVHNNLCAYKFTVFFFCNKNSIFAKIGAFLHLDFNIIHCLLHLIQNTAFKNHVFNHVHIFSNFRFNSVKPDKANAGPGEKMLRIFPEQKNGYCTNLIAIHKILVLAQIFFCSF